MSVLASAWRRYRTAAAEPGMNRLLPAVLVSSIGTGISVVAVPMLALSIASPEYQEVAVAAVVAAYILPGVAGGLLLGRILSGREPAALVAMNSMLRAVLFFLIAVLAVLGKLTIPLLVVLIGLSSVAHVWWLGGRTALIRQLVTGDVMPVNALASSSAAFAGIVGPALGGLLVAATSAAHALAIDGATFALLAMTALSVRRLARETAQQRSPSASPSGQQGLGRASDQRLSGVRVLWEDAMLRSLLLLSFSAATLAGFLDVGLPLFAAEKSHNSSHMLGVMWAAFGAGMLVGTLLVGAVRRFPLYDAAVVIALSWGLVMTVALLPAAVPPMVVGLFAAGVMLGPYPALASTALQERLRDNDIASGAAAWGAFFTAAPALGTFLAGLIASGFDGVATLRVSAVGMVIVGLTAATLRVRSRLRAWRAPRADSIAEKPR